jgi:hypothetical protein
MTVNRIQKLFQNYLPLPLAESRIYKRLKASLVEVEEKYIKKFGDVKIYVYHLTKGINIEVGRALSQLG